MKSSVVLRGLVISCCSAGCLATASTLRIDFEEPAYRPGSIQGQNGWTIEQGVAEVDAKAGRGGGAALVMQPADPFSQATLRLEAATDGTTLFMDFYVLPVATSQDQMEEMLDIDGARIGFFRSEAEPEKGRFWLFHGDGEGGGEWVRTDVVLNVDVGTGRPDGWVRLTLREDLTRQAWDLWVNETLAGCDAGFQEKASGDTSSYVIMGDAVEHLVLDDLAIGNTNPLGNDADRDGMLDEHESAIGSNPAVADIDELDATGVPLRDKWTKFIAEYELAMANGPQSPVFSRPSGLATQPFSLKITAEGANTVYFTTDGSEPAPATSRVLNDSVDISTTTVIRARAAGSGGKLSDTVTAAWIFPEQVPGQGLPEGWPASLSNTSGTLSFPLYPGVKTSDTGALPSMAEVAATFSQVPIVVLALPPEQLFGDSGIYEQSHLDLSASGALIWIEEKTQRSGGAGKVTFQISGESSRDHEVTMKHSFRAIFPNATDAGPVFGVQTFPCAQIALRNPTQDSWAVGGNQSRYRAGAKYVMDAWASRWLENQGHTALRHQWVHVFLNGCYWGVYDAVEQHDAAYKMRHGESSGEILIAPTSEGAPRAIVGNAASWHERLASLRHLAGFGALASEEQWEHVTSDVDLEGLADYVLWNWWLGNYDWPVKNWLLTKTQGKWSFVSWDAEVCGDWERADGAAQRLAADAYGPGAAFVALTRWGKFRELVHTRYTRQVAGVPSFGAPSLLASLEQQEASFADVVAAESARWGWYYQRRQFTPTDWKTSITFMKEFFVADRTAVVSTEVELWLNQQERQSRPREPMTTEEVVDVPVADQKLTDVDNDGLPDAWEKRFGLDPANIDDAIADSDEDGLSNLEEFFRGSNPLVSNERRTFDENAPGLHTRFMGKQPAPFLAPANEEKDGVSTPSDTEER